MFTLGLLLSEDGYMQRSLALPGVASSAQTLNSALEQLSAKERMAAVVINTSAARASKFARLNKLGYYWIAIDRSRMVELAEPKPWLVLQSSAGRARAHRALQGGRHGAHDSGRSARSAQGHQGAQLDAHQPDELGRNAARGRLSAADADEQHPATGAGPAQLRT